MALVVLWINFAVHRAEEAYLIDSELSWAAFVLEEGHQSRRISFLHFISYTFSYE
jgi:hypothetical protein